MAETIDAVLDRIKAQQCDLNSMAGADNALSFLQAVYRDQRQPPPVRIRCATEALPYENPKLSAVAVTSLTGNEFAMRLDRSIMRSTKLIEAKAVEPSPE
jgi:hypothetical protein